jgi:hypothetical protein
VVFPALVGFSRDDVCPDAFGKVKINKALLVENRDDQERVSQHVLGIEVFAGDIIIKFNRHGAHHRDSRFMGFHSLGIEVRH